MNSTNELRIVLKEYLNQYDVKTIDELQKKCIEADKVAMKLELHYKHSLFLTEVRKPGINKINEFLCFNGDLLVGYVGICAFGGIEIPAEIMGLVHPNYRRQGIFSRLVELAIAECKRRKYSDIYLLCDRLSKSGQSFLKSINATYNYSEYEMYLTESLENKDCKVQEGKLENILLRKADNSDIAEVARQNSIYFGDPSLDGRQKDMEKDNLYETIDLLRNEGVIIPE
ncbi:MAG: GNAT family N-acetyltransferase, partial [Candidatus Methanomethyliaceae archaeon]|nr:GNAT family N-acetyltransferase [Candidatus Methanomethyliaceae archaeon]